MATILQMRCSGNHFSIKCVAHPLLNLVVLVVVAQFLILMCDAGNNNLVDNKRYCSYISSIGSGNTCFAKDTRCKFFGNPVVQHQIVSSDGSTMSSRLRIAQFPKRRHDTNQISMISSVKIRIVGKKSGGGGSDGWLLDAYGMYETRLRGTLDVETTWHKQDSDLVSAVDGDQKKGHFVVLLDPLGKTMSSEEFSNQFYEWMDMGGSRMSFVIGGAEGLPKTLKTMVFQQGRAGANAKVAALSLSAMTMTHQFTRVFLLEQIYRATEIQKGTGYHK